MQATQGREIALFSLFLPKLGTVAEIGIHAPSPSALSWKSSCGEPVLKRLPQDTQ